MLMLIIKIVKKKKITFQCMNKQSTKETNNFLHNNPVVLLLTKCVVFLILLKTSVNILLLLSNSEI